MPRRQRSPTGAQANFYINNCGDLRSFQPFRTTGAPSARTAFSPSWKAQWRKA
jgi:hypothetical protein